MYKIEPLGHHVLFMFVLDTGVQSISVLIYLTVFGPLRIFQI